MISTFPTPGSPPALFPEAVGPETALTSSTPTTASAPPTSSAEPWRPTRDDGIAASHGPARATVAPFDLGEAANLVLRLLGGAPSSPTTSATEVAHLELGSLLIEVLELAARLVEGPPQGSLREASRPAATAAKQERPSTRNKARPPRHADAPGHAPEAAGRPTSERRVSTQGSGSIGDAGGPLELAYAGAARAHVRHGAGTSGSGALDARGARARGVAEASLEAQAEAEGTLHTSLGSARGRVSARAELFARAEGEVSIDTKGVAARGSAEAGATAQVAAEVDAKLLNGIASADATATAESGAGARAKASVIASFDPPAAALQGSAGAFAGARSGVTASAGVLGAKATMTAEVWAGIGATADVDMGLKDGVLRIDYGVGLAVGVGGYQQGSWEIDVSGVLGALSGIAGFAGQLLEVLGVDLAAPPGREGAAAPGAGGLDVAASLLMDFVTAELRRDDARREEPASAPLPESDPGARAQGAPSPSPRGSGRARKIPERSGARVRT